MELELSGDQELLRTTTVKYCADRLPLATLRELIDTPDRTLPAGYVEQSAELGWFALLVPEDLGGGSVSGEGLRDLAIVAEERGRALQPGPFIGTNVAARALVVGGSEQQRNDVLSTLVAGEAVAAWAVTDGRGEQRPGSGIAVRRHDGGVELNGVATLVQDACEADWILLASDDDGCPALYLLARDTPGLVVREIESLDVTQHFAHIELDGVRVSTDSEIGGADPAALLEDLVDHAALLTAIDTVGAMDALFELTRSYALDRIAFGRPIGSFQAVKHQLADMSLSLEASKAVVATATRSLQAATEDASQCVSMAKAWISDAAPVLAQGCFQIFAGIGFSWEHDCHLYLRRVTQNAELHGSADWHRVRLLEIYGKKGAFA